MPISSCIYKIQLFDFCRWLGNVVFMGCFAPHKHHTYPKITNTKSNDEKSLLKSQLRSLFISRSARIRLEDAVCLILFDGQVAQRIVEG